MTASSGSQTPSSKSTDASAADAERTSRDHRFCHPAFDDASATQKTLAKLEATRGMLETLLKVAERYPEICVEHGIRAGATAAERELKELESNPDDAT